MSIRSLTLSLLASTALAGCVTEGHDFNSDTTWIKDKRTTQADVRSVLHEPYEVGSSNGQPTWTYSFGRYKLIGKSLVKELKIYWNPDGTVDHYSFNSSFPEDTNRAKPAVGGAAPAAAASQPLPEY